MSRHFPRHFPKCVTHTQWQGGLLRGGRLLKIVAYIFLVFLASPNNLLATIRRLVNDVLMTVLRQQQHKLQAAHAHKITNFNYSAYYESGFKMKAGAWVVANH